MTQVKSSISPASLVAYCFMLGFLPSPSAAQDASLTGIWRHEANKSETSERCEAINDATKGLGLLMRDRVNEHLREATEPLKELTLTKENGQLTFSSNGRHSKMTIGGPPTRVTGERGEGTTQAHYKDEKLVMIVRAESGTRTTIFQLSDDGKRMTLEVSLDSKKLGKPISYRETYVRH